MSKQPWRLATNAEIAQAIKLALQELVERASFQPAVKMAAEMSVMDIEEQVRLMIEMINNRPEPEVA